VRSKGRVERNAAGAAAVRRLPVLETLGWSNRDVVGFAVVLAGTIIILVNTLFLQPGPHPAPMVKSSIAAITAPNPVASPAPAGKANPPAARRDEPAPQRVEQTKSAQISAPAAAPRPSTAIVADIQRELARRGFYDGVVDGRYGPRTDASIRDFEQAAGLRPSTEPNEVLLRAIQRSPVRSRPGPQRPPAPIPQAKPDAIAELISPPSKQVIAVQRALSEFGYGQINPTGIVDTETQSAIQRFERERKLPVTGQLSHRVVRELAAITGRPLE
jgi:peptidoglycan hydrolase-like protein with peptidoglycan-binding domain